MTKLTIDLEEYSEEDQELIEKFLHKFEPIPDKWKYMGDNWMKLDGSKNIFSYKGKICFRNHVETTEDPIWKPEEDEIYWHVEVYGTVRDERYYNNDGTSSKSFDVIQYEKGNVFKTKEAAQRMADRRKRIGIFENKMMEFASNEVVRLFKYYIAYGVRGWRKMHAHEYDPMQIYMTEEQAKKAVEWANKYYPEGV